MLNSSVEKSNSESIKDYQYAYRTNVDGLMVMEFDPVQDKEPRCIFRKSDAYHFSYSPDGKKMAILVYDGAFQSNMNALFSNPEVKCPNPMAAKTLHPTTPRWIEIMDTDTWQILHSIKSVGTVDDSYYWSPKSNFLVTWHSQQASDPQQGVKIDCRLKVWSIKTGEELLSYNYTSRQVWPIFQWTEDEKMALRRYRGILYLYDWGDFTAKYERRKSLAMADTATFTSSESILNTTAKVSCEKENGTSNVPTGPKNTMEPAENCPGGVIPMREVLMTSDGAIDVWALSRSAVAVYVLRKDRNLDSVHIYTLNPPNGDNSNHLHNMIPVSKMDVCKTDYPVNLLWHSRGQALLVFMRSNKDGSNKNYYGSTFLYYLSVDGKGNLSVVLDREGPIHDVQWNLRGNDFAVTYGNMPSKTMLYNRKCKPVGNLVENSRNKIIWSPQGRIVLVGGFGQLKGEFDIWDTSNFVKLGTGMASCSSLQEWSSDGKYLLMSVIWPRMRVDNEYKIFDLYGRCILMRRAEELRLINWRPRLNATPAYSRDGGIIQIQSSLNAVSSKKAIHEEPSEARTLDQNPAEKAVDYRRFHKQRFGDEEEENAAPSSGGGTARNMTKDENVSSPKRMVAKEPTKGTSIVDPKVERIRQIQCQLNTIRQLKENLASNKQLNEQKLKKIDAEKDLINELESLRVQIKK